MLIPWYVRKNPWFGAGQIPRDRDWEGATCSRMRSWSRLLITWSLNTTLNSAESQLRQAGPRLLFKLGSSPHPPGQFSTDKVRHFGFRGMPSLLSFFDFFPLILPSIPPCFLLSHLILPLFFFISVSVVFFHFPYFLSTQMNFFHRPLRHNREDEQTKSSLSWGQYMPPFLRNTSDLLPVTYATDRFRRF